MRGCRKSKALLLCCLVIILSGWDVCYAGGKFVKIKQAQLSLIDNKAKLSILLDFKLSPEAEEALYSGIALFWDVSIELKQKKRFWDKTLFAHTYRYSLTYYTLLDNFRVKDERKKTFRRFYSLSEALAFMQHIETEEMPLSGYVAKQCVISVLNISFDKEMLPAPLRPVAYFDSQWDLSTNEKRWCE
ncbi:DUF4390 domain-containing protein [Methyloprofundus sedimenti]|nr:DUF4390 domain-containing protein [Methyloprofundus sedimenti]